MTTEQLMMRLGFEARQAELGLAKMKSELGAFAAEQKAAQKKASAERIMMSKQESAAIDEIARKADVEQAARNNRAAALWRAREQSRAKASAEAEQERVAAAKAADAEITALEITNAGRRNRARALLRGRALVQAERAEKVAGEIAAGSGGFAWTASLAKDAKMAGKGLKTAGKEMHGLSSVFRETAVLVREGFRGNWTRMMGSFTLLFQYIGAFAAAVAIPLAAILAVPGWKAYKARKVQEESEASLNSSIGRAKDAARVQFDAIKKSGRLSGSEQDRLSKELSEAKTAEEVSAVMLKLKKIRGGSSLDSLENEKEMQRLDEEHKKKMLQFNREDLDDNFKLTFDQLQRHIIAEKMAQLDKNSVEYKQKQLELDDANRQVQQDLVALAKKKNDEARTLADRIVSNQQKLATAQAEYPTIENLAGRGFVKRLNAMYGQGGIYDLGTGAGRLGGVARDYLIAQKRQIWERTYGTSEGAEKQRRIMMSDLSLLSANGAASPQQNMMIVAQKTTAMAAHLFKLVGTVKGNQILTAARLLDDK